MPLYDCRCNTCGHESEYLLAAAEPNPPCEECGQRTERLIGLPSVQTDSTFMAGVGTLRDQVGDQHVPMIAGLAQHRGASITGDEMYCASLARFPGDPEAFITTRHEAKKILKKRNWNSEGAVTNKAVTNHSQKPPPRLAESIVDRFEQQYIRENPDLAKNRAELRHNIIEKHGSKD